MKSLKVFGVIAAMTGLLLLAACGNGAMKDSKSGAMKQSVMKNDMNKEKKGAMSGKSGTDMNQKMDSSKDMKSH
jgi:ABC-type glycerol-3-phosphate transport system substrate-binding protein